MDDQNGGGLGTRLVVSCMVDGGITIYDGGKLARVPLLVSLHAGVPGGRSWCRACPDSAPSKQLGRLKMRELSGGFYYKGSALVASPCRSRFIPW